MKQGLKLSAITSLWQNCFGFSKSAKLANVWNVNENQFAYSDEAI